MPIARCVVATLLQRAYWSVRYSRRGPVFPHAMLREGASCFSSVRFVACVDTLLTAVSGGRAGRRRPVSVGPKGGPPAINFQTWNMRVRPGGTASTNPACKSKAARWRSLIVGLPSVNRSIVTAASSGQRTTMQTRSPWHLAFQFSTPACAHRRLPCVRHQLSIIAPLALEQPYSHVIIWP